MKDFVKRMIEEHAQLVVRIKKLHAYIYDGRGENDEAYELADKCMQLTAMKQYACALESRLHRAGIVATNGEYLEHVAHIEEDNESEEENGTNDCPDCPDDCPGGGCPETPNGADHDIEIHIKA